MAQDGSRAGTAGRIAALRLRGSAGWLPAIRVWFVAGLALEAEQRRLLPWLAVAFGIGVLAYFTATAGEPALWAPLGLAGLLGAMVPLCDARPVARALLLGAIAVVLGFSAGALRVAGVASPILARTTIAPLTGFVESLDERDEGARLVILVESFGTLPADVRPRRVRVSYKTKQSLKPGDFIAANARLLPPPEAARPGGYDFARDAFFRGLGAVGSLVGKIEVRPPPRPLPPRLRLAAAVDEARNALTRRITDAIGGQAGAVAAALVTGKRGLIDAQTNEVLRAAGIYHVVSISGLHMVLAAGVVFWIVRAALATVPFLALHAPIKKIAAVFAMAGVTAYCVFSGWDIAAERALNMTLVMLGAILVDRPALSMRNLALAALIALAREPEGVLGPSFQMSFGAVAGLIACARHLDGSFLRREADGRVGRALATIAAAVIGTLATTLVAQIATAPFSTYHFQAVQPFGIVGNALTLPLVSLAVMPAAVIGILAYPFALDQPVWWLMGLAVQGMLAISTWISGFGHASVMIPAFGPGALALLAAALVVLALPVSGLRWLGLAPAALGVALAATPDRNDVYIDRQGAGAAVRDRSGRLAALGRPPAFVMEQWLKADGDSRQAKQVIAASTARCDRIGCTIEAQGGRTIALLKDRRGFREDCARADILVARLDAPAGCGASLIVDRTFLRLHGATAIRFTPEGPSLVTTRRPGEAKPWRPAAVPVAAKAQPPPPDSIDTTETEDGDLPADAPAERLQ